MTSRCGGSVDGRRVLITGAARGIGAALARQLSAHGAKVALLGLEPELLAQVAGDCGEAPWRYCDVSDRAQVDAAVEAVVGELGGLDVVVANAGVAKQLPLIGGDPLVMEQTLAVNVLGVYYTVRAAGPHISHPEGYALVVSSLAAAVHLPLLGAYNASKAGVEALGDTLRHELRHTGVKVGVAYFAELDTDMTSRGFGTEAARSLLGRATVSVWHRWARPSTPSNGPSRAAVVRWFRPGGCGSSSRSGRSRSGSPNWPCGAGSGRRWPSRAPKRHPSRPSSRSEPAEWVSTRPTEHRSSHP